jgi:hypothetical protein
LEAGTDPAIVGQWIAEVTATRQAAEAALHQLETAPEPLPPEAIEAAPKEVGGLAPALDKADPALRLWRFERISVGVRYVSEGRLEQYAYQHSPRRSRCRPAHHGRDRFRTCGFCRDAAVDGQAVAATAVGACKAAKTSRAT